MQSIKHPHKNGNKNANARTGSSAKSGKNGAPQTLREPHPPFPAQHQKKPGIEGRIHPRPEYQATLYKSAAKLQGKVALITGGDSGIGRAVAVIYGREGADVAIVYLPAEQADARETQQAVEEQGRKCLLIPGDLTDKKFCEQAVKDVIAEFGKLDILVSNAAYQNRIEGIENVTDVEFDRTFQTNVYAHFWLCRAAVPHMKAGASIITTSSETGLLGSENLLAYSSTKGALNAFTKTLAMDLVEKGIRVNAVAPGPVWTPLNIADKGKTAKQVSQFGRKTLFGRPAQPEELGPAYVFLASDADSSFVTGVILEEMGKTTG